MGVCVDCCEKTTKVAGGKMHLKSNSIFFREFYIWFPLSVAVFLLASVLMTGWPDGLLPNIKYPYSFIGDSQGVINIIKRVVEEPWFFQNWRSGYPFGSNHLDFPSSDSGPIFIVKIIGIIFGGSFVAAYNLYYLLSFPLAFICSYFVLRLLKINMAYAVAGALAYAFASFHFQRLPHYFYISYYFVPLFFYALFKISGMMRSDGDEKIEFKKYYWVFFLFFFSAFFGAYYACFELLCLAFVLIFIFIREGLGRRALICVAAMVFVLSGLLVNVAPALKYKTDYGANSSVATRGMGESEIYGLKVTQMLMPRADHRSPHMVRLAQTYIQNFPLVNENHTANLGLLGSMGLVVSFFVVVTLLAGRRVTGSVALASSLIFFITLFATVGGMASLFSMLVSTQIRGWNRISIFILFLAIFVFLYWMNAVVARVAASKKTLYRSLIFSSALLFCVVAIYDQTVPPCVECNKKNEMAFNADVHFVEEMERKLSPGAAVYQLPYLSFPESGGVNKLGDYDLLIPFFLSQHLKFNFGGMRGRPGDDFFSRISSLPISEQIAIVKRLGFSAIYLDRRGYKDEGKAIEAHIRNMPGVHFLMQDAGGLRLVFRVDNAAPLIPDSTKPADIYKIAGLSEGFGFGFYEDSLGKLPRQVGTFDGAAVSTDGKSGFLVYGPYKKINIGKYRLKVYGSARSLASAWVDATSNLGATRLLQTPLKYDSTATSNVLVDQSFEVLKAANDFEVRVFVTAESDFRITGYEIVEDR